MVRADCGVFGFYKRGQGNTRPLSVCEHFQKESTCALRWVRGAILDELVVLIVIFVFIVSFIDWPSFGQETCGCVGVSKVCPLRTDCPATKQGNLSKLGMTTSGTKGTHHLVSRLNLNLSVLFAPVACT